MPLYRDSPMPDLIQWKLTSQERTFAPYNICRTGLSTRLGYNRLMTPQEQSRVEQLCEEIAVEKNPERLLRLVRQLNELLERSQRRLSQDSNASLIP